MASGRVVGIVVARMGSTRVPGKALLDVVGRPVLWHVLHAALEVRGLDALCLATSVLPQDDPLVRMAGTCGIRCVRGDPERVLDRVYQAVGELEADTVVSIGGDCPLFDPDIISEALANFWSDPCDYLSNYDPPTFPEGMDINIVSRRALDAAFRNAIAPSQRIHPFSYITRHPEQFSIRNYQMTPDLSTYHWSLDFPEDIEFVRGVYENLYKPGKAIRMGEILDLIGANSSIAKLNRKLAKPKALHAFWNSPGIVRDMNEDITALCQRALEATGAGDYTLAANCYSEVQRIAAELRRMTQFRSQESAASTLNTN